MLIIVCYILKLQIVICRGYNHENSPNDQCRSINLLDNSEKYS